MSLHTDTVNDLKDYLGSVRASALRRQQSSLVVTTDTNRDSLAARLHQELFALSQHNQLYLAG
jgi:hypothetical protein